MEVNMRPGDFAVASVAAATQVEAGCFKAVHLTWSGADYRPLSVPTLAARLVGEPADGSTVDALAAEMLSGLEPPSDHRGSAAYRRQALQVLTRRALRAAAQRADQAGAK